MTDVIVIPALGDNFIYLHRYGDGLAFVVDPGDAAPVLDALRQRNLRLTTVLATHHHSDHIGGTAKLKSHTRCLVVGAHDRRMPWVDRPVADGDTLVFGRCRMDVIATPGHTNSSLCYHLPAAEGRPGVVYTGDTLFIGGCGRLIECDARTMWQSLQRLAALPEQTLVYCGHDYTLENYAFAVATEPDNDIVRRRRDALTESIAQGILPVPSTIAQERATNIFLRANDTRLRDVLDGCGTEPFQVLAELRRRKDMFG